MSDLLNRALPKWPQHYVTGQPVTVEQAKEIIRRTDTFFDYGGGNDREYAKWVRAQVKRPVDSWDLPAGSDWDAHDKKLDKWRENWGFIRTSYVHNSWISSSFVGGPHGWCHPDGQIGFIDNVGKWPSVNDIFNDWQILAAAFPFLDIGATLFSGEAGEDDTHPVVSMIISDGTVKLIDPFEVKVHENHPRATRSGSNADPHAWCSMFDLKAEQGIPRAWIEEWGRRCP